MLRAVTALPALMIAVAVAGYPQSSHSKADTALAGITADQHVTEYCEQYYRNGFRDHDYTNLLESYVLRDGTEAPPSLIKAIDDYDPATKEGRSPKSEAWGFAAEGLLHQLDQRCIRLRATEIGMKAIQSMERVIQRMHRAGFDFENGPGYSKQLSRYQETSILLKEMQGINFLDSAIQDTLRIKYGISLSEGEMLGFVRYLIASDPRYPGWAEREGYWDPTTLNAAGTASRRVIVKNHERFYRLYLSYKAGTPP